MRRRPTPAKTLAPAVEPAVTQATAADNAAADWLALDHQLCFALYAASLAMTKAYKPLLAPLDLTYPQYLVMLVLWEMDGDSDSANPAEGITVSQLGERLTLDSGTLTPLLKRLQAQGRLQRQRDPADERRVRLRLTSTGRALRALALPIPQAIACATACDLQQIGQLAGQLTTLRRQLQTLSSGTATAA
jgi:MarR family transcriptional regulator, organic hydroperoxide resistance regulator